MPNDGRRLARGVSGLGCAALAACLAWIVRLGPAREADLAETIEKASAARGIENEVTAVLLDFRGYDTLLEIAVLMAALTGVWGAGVRVRVETPRPEPRAREPIGDPSGLLAGLVRMLFPIGLMVAAYLGWAGSWAPGGAFQAGTVLASLLILLILSHDLDARRALAPPVRALCSVGIWVFIAVGLGTLIGGRTFLDYPTGWLKPLFWLIEGVLAISIAVILSVFFAETSESASESASESDGGRS